MLYEEYFRKYLKLKDEKGGVNKLENKKIFLMSMVDVQAIPPKDSIGGTNIKEEKRYSKRIKKTIKGKRRRFKGKWWRIG